MDGPVFRDAAPADGAAVAALFNRAFCDTFAHLYRREDLDAFLAGSTAGDWAAEIAEPGVAVRLAEVGGRTVAFAKMGPLSLPVEGEPGALELRSLYVLGPWHGTGIARELMDWVLGEARARHAPALYLSVYIDNPRARRFYERYGFEAVGRYDFMVGNHADEDIIMRLGLKK
jgi:GNAT superfamily N-acetyltransferase